MKRALVSLALLVTTSVCTETDLMVLRELLRQYDYREACWSAGGVVVETAEAIECLGQAPAPAPDEEA